MTDIAPLLDVRPEPPRWVTRMADVLSWALPVAAAGLSIAGGVEALSNANSLAATLGIGGGVASAFGVGVTNWSSRIRDRHLERAMAMAGLAIENVEYANRRQPIHS